MEIRIFAHSWLSDWNHGNAHFLRGMARALVHLGHGVELYEPLPGPWGGWSLAHLIAEEPLLAMSALGEFRRAYPDLAVNFYAVRTNGEGRGRWATQVAEIVRGADLVLVHEWNPPELLAELAAARQRQRFLLLFHDTHHRAVSDPAALRRLPLGACDAVLVFGAALRAPYAAMGCRRTYVWHEAADETQFFPRAARREQDVLWIGNWGDGERDGILREFLLQPAAQMPEARFAVHGVRYPEAARAALRAAGVRLRGYLPNLRAPAAYAASGLTLHLPRAPYQGPLAGIPTIRVFEVLACGAPLVCAPWHDTEALFEAGADYLVARDGREMRALLRDLLRDAAAARALGEHGRATIMARHTCRQRALELLEICRQL
ncbi:MAG TPA: glycosyltransferase [Terriglobales bacterium]|nr:glycosyltransferase [Terriglobales bacterium]